MQTLIPKLGQTSLISKKPGFLSENLKTLMSSNYPTVQYFLKVITESVKNECIETRSFLIFEYNSGPK